MTTTPTSPRIVAAVGRAVAEHTFARHGATGSERLRWFVDGLAAALTTAGYEQRDTAGPDVQVVLHTVDLDRPRPYRRRHAPTFVVAIAAVPGRPDDVLRVGYPVLVRALANVVVLVSDEPAAHFVTLEQGTSTVDGGDATFFTRVAEQLAPLASSRLVIANEFRPDLEPGLRAGDEQTRQIGHAARGSARCTCSRTRSRSRSCSPSGTCAT